MMRKTQQQRIRGLKYLQDAAQYDPVTRRFWIERTLKHSYKISAKAYSKEKIDELIGIQFKRYVRFLKFSKRKEQIHDNRLQSGGCKGNRKVVAHQKNGRKRSGR